MIFTCVIEEALVVDVDLAQRPLAQPVGLGQHSLLEVVDEVPGPDPLELLLEPVDHVAPGLRHQQVFDAGLTTTTRHNVEYAENNVYISLGRFRYTLK